MPQFRSIDDFLFLFFLSLLFDYVSDTFFVHVTAAVDIVVRSRVPRYISSPDVSLCLVLLFVCLFLTFTVKNNTNWDRKWERRRSHVSSSSLTRKKKNKLYTYQHRLRATLKLNGIHIPCYVFSKRFYVLFRWLEYMTWYLIFCYFLHSIFFVMFPPFLRHLSLAFCIFSNLIGVRPHTRAQ